MVSGEAEKTVGGVWGKRWKVMKYQELMRILKSCDPQRGAAAFQGVQRLGQRATLCIVGTKFFLCIFALTLLQLFASEPVAHTAALEGHKIHYLSTGEGDEALVFIHGWTCDSTFWKAQSPVYESRRALLIDLPGHGQSDKPDISYTMGLFARAVNAVMLDAKVRKATLIGHSMGTAVAVEFLRMYPDKVASIVIVDGFFPLPPKDEADRQKQVAQGTGTSKALRADDYKAFDKRVIQTMFTPQTAPVLREEIETKMMAIPQNVMASAMEGMNAMAPLTERYPRVPVEAIMQKRGNSAAYEAVLKQHFQLVTFQAWDDTGHFLMMEHPERFNKVLVDFLDRK
jgi:pimeloyl-ACP methyl ester carboxylesterase